VQADAQVAGRILTDMTFLRNEGYLDVTYKDQDTGNPTKPHFRVVYGLVPNVEGRNLRCEVKWLPKGDEGDTKKRKRPSHCTIKVIGSGQFSIASAFKQGTG